MRLIDTARAYGNAEAIIGRTMQSVNSFQIVTKTPVFLDSRISSADGATLIKEFRQSLTDLGVPLVYGLMIHKADNLLSPGGEKLFNQMVRLRTNGLIKKIGVSVYSACQIDVILDRFPIDLIQVPVSVLDQRLIESDHLKKLKQRGVEIHARSAFLRGLIFAEPDLLPPHFEQVKSTLSELRAAADEDRIDIATAALSFLLDIEEIDTVLIGVTRSNQLTMALDGIRRRGRARLRNPKRFSVTDPKIVSPIHWPAFKTVER